MQVVCRGVYVPALFPEKSWQRLKAAWGGGDDYCCWNGVFGIFTGASFLPDNTCIEGGQIWWWSGGHAAIPARNCLRSESPSGHTQSRSQQSQNDRGRLRTLRAFEQVAILRVEDPGKEREKSHSVKADPSHHFRRLLFRPLVKSKH